MENNLINLEDCTSDELQVLQERITAKRLGAIENQVKELTDGQCKLTVKLDKITNEMTIDYSQQEELRALANKVAVEALEYGSPAYKELSKKTFSTIWKEYKRVMEVNSYRNTAVAKFEKGKDFLKNWEPDRELELMIRGANSQTNFIKKVM